MSRDTELLALLLENSEIITFEYWSEFILGIQRDDRTRHPLLQEMFGDIRIPSQFRLRLRGTWRIGDRHDWDAAVRDSPIRGSAPIPVEAPLQASLLMTKLGKQISALRVSESSDLTLQLSDGSSIVVRGTGGQWEENWLLELPVEDPDRDLWSIVCGSDGLISAKFPPKI
jgi:hypothetical protein